MEEMVSIYSNEKEVIKKETILSNIFEEMNGYIGKSVNNAYMKPKKFGLEIPKEDFESRFMQYLWEAVESFQVGGSTFKNIVLRRFEFAEKHTWRQYKTKGNESDKNGISYESARLDSLDKRISGSVEGKATLAQISFWKAISAEDEFLDQIEENTIITEFSKVNERYANIIRYMMLGYEGDALAIVTGEADSNNAKVRKLVQRSKESFRKFLKFREKQY
ncbi:BacL2 family protein [Psychrobacillus sp. FSL H8-0484]|uniref:BacL2 family protein n=1 Tax=Psychrobacillus sp. FSL H8-0484 TaxID=2921390 RepID=UPI0030F4C7B1